MVPGIEYEVLYNANRNALSRKIVVRIAYSIACGPNFFNIRNLKNFSKEYFLSYFSIRILTCALSFLVVFS